jgi:CHAT domain-containing protein
MREAALLERMDPSIRHLTGTGATKAALERAWKRAGTLFFATHVVEDPESPLARFVPLAPDAERADETGEVLELADVLGADLSRCELVVLSGCATGVPALWGSSAGPSLAEAFLDAGAGAVIHTAWPVRDDHAEATMAAFIRSWKKHGQPPAAALCEARRRLAANGHGFRHPASWAAYRISLKASPPE